MFSLLANFSRTLNAEADEELSESVDEISRSRKFVADGVFYVD